jgi:hypothetical protein
MDTVRSCERFDAPGAGIDNRFFSICRFPFFFYIIRGEPFFHRKSFIFTIVTFTFKYEMPRMQ